MDYVALYVFLGAPVFITIFVWISYHRLNELRVGDLLGCILVGFLPLVRELIILEWISPKNILDKVIIRKETKCTK